MVVCTIGYDNRCYVDTLFIIKGKELMFTRSLFAGYYIHALSVLQVNVIFISIEKETKAQRN